MMIPKSAVPSKNVRPFQRPEKETPQTIFAAFDLETSGLGGKLLAGSTCAPDGSLQFYCGTPEKIVSDMVDYMFSFPYVGKGKSASRVIWYAHNAQYDWRYILHYCVKNRSLRFDVSMRSERDIFQIKIKRGSKKKPITIIMRDSYAVFPKKLSDFSAQFSPELPKGEINFDGGIIFNPENPDHVDYALRDVACLRASLIAYDAAVRSDYGVGLGATASGTALKAWQASLSDGEAYWPSYGLDARWGRDAYYGGLVFLTSVDTHESCTTYDINSSFPAVMRSKGVPDGASWPSDSVQFEHPAFYDVEVTSPPDLSIPILPCRVDGTTKWPRGDFRTICTNAELLFAVKNGYSINKCHGGLEFEKIVFPFTAFVDKAEKIRLSAKKTPREDVAKLMQNSVYGKFGTRLERTAMQVFSEYPTIDMLDPTAKMWDDEGHFWISKQVADIPIKPEWAAWITAQARLALLRTAYAQPIGTVLYADTDSLTVVGEGVGFDVGDGYGQWKIDKVWKTFTALGAKLYAGEKLTKDGDYVWTGAAKGLPKKKMGEIEWRTLGELGALTINYDTLPSLLTTLKNGDLMEAQQVTRCASDILNSGNFEVENGRVQPKTIKPKRIKSKNNSRKIPTENRKIGKSGVRKIA